MLSTESRFSWIINLSSLITFLNFELFTVFIVINLNFDPIVVILIVIKVMEAEEGLLKIHFFLRLCLYVCKRGSNGTLTSSVVCCVFIASSSFLTPFSWGNHSYSNGKKHSLLYNVKLKQNILD